MVSQPLLEKRAQSFSQIYIPREYKKVCDNFYIDVTAGTQKKRTTSCLLQIKNGEFKTYRLDLSDLPEDIFLQNYTDFMTAIAQQKTLERDRKSIISRTLAFDGRSEKRIEYLKTYNKLILSTYEQSDFEKERLVDLINREDPTQNSPIVLLATSAFSTFKLQDLLAVATHAPDTSALHLITQKYKARYGVKTINSLLTRQHEIEKLPHLNSFFLTIENNKRIKPQEANFLNTASERIKKLAHDDFGCTENFNGVREALGKAGFAESCQKIWNEMYQNFDKYATYKMCLSDNKIIRELFAEQVRVLSPKIQERGIDGAIDYYQRLDKTLKYIRKYEKEHKTTLNGELHIDMVNGGINTETDMFKCLELWQTLNKRPDKYSSPMNKYTMKDIATAVKHDVPQEWMRPVILEALTHHVYTPDCGKMPDVCCCKAWKINPAFPQKLAENIGSHPLVERMLAGVIFDKIGEAVKISPQEWDSNYDLQFRFFAELSQAKNMEPKLALKHYIPNTAINRKRLVGAYLEDKKIDCTKQNFEKIYRDFEKRKVFETYLAEIGKEKLFMDIALLKGLSQKGKQIA